MTAASLLVLLAAAAAFFSPSAMAVDFTDCVGSGRGAVPLEAQDWWSDKGGGGTFGHVHIVVCVPIEEAVADSMTVDVSVTMHENPGKLVAVVARGHDGTERDVKLAAKTFSPPIPGDPMGDVSVDLRFTFSTRKLDNNSSCTARTVCYQEIRIKAIVAVPHTRFSSRPARRGGDEMQPIVRFPEHIENTNPVGYSDFSDGHVEGVGWYTGTGYARAIVRDYPVGPVLDDWTPLVKTNTDACDIEFGLACPANNGFGPYDAINPDGSLPLRSWAIHVDPNFHTGDPGCVVATKDTSGLPAELGDYTAFSLGACMPPAGSGWHKLVVRVDSPDINSAGNARLSSNSGLLVVHFQR
jgi:hypothetical protein